MGGMDMDVLSVLVAVFAIVGAACGVVIFTSFPPLSLFSESSFAVRYRERFLVIGGACLVLALICFIAS
jgi:predicted ferric reductase